MDYKIYRNNFGKVLQKIRLKKGLSQEQLAFSCELDRTYISMLERSIRQPSLTTIVKLANALGVKPSKLLVLTEKEIK